MIGNDNQFFTLYYCGDDKYKDIKLISKEQKEYKVIFIFVDIYEMIKSSNIINNNDKKQLKEIFLYNEKK